MTIGRFGPIGLRKPNGQPAVGAVTVLNLMFQA